MAEIEHPDSDFDQLAPSLADVDEIGEAIIETEEMKGIERLACVVAIYWLTLKENDIPAKEATKLTREWMWICEG